MYGITHGYLASVSDGFNTALSMASPKEGETEGRNCLQSGQRQRPWATQALDHRSVACSFSFISD